MLQTMASVQLKCFSFTEAYACASLTATAEAWAEATAGAHASAVSSAVSGCGCLTDAVADSFSDASVYLKLVAEAASTATATVCLDGAHPMVIMLPNKYTYYNIFSTLMCRSPTARHLVQAALATFFDERRCWSLKAVYIGVKVN